MSTVHHIYPTTASHHHHHHRKNQTSRSRKYISICMHISSAMIYKIFSEVTFTNTGDFYSSTNTWSHGNYLSIPKLQRQRRWSLRRDEYFYLTFYNGCNYLYMLGLKSMHVSKRGPWPQCHRYVPDTSAGHLAPLWWGWLINDSIYKFQTSEVSQYLARYYMLLRILYIR